MPSTAPAEIVLVVVLAAATRLLSPATFYRSWLRPTRQPDLTRPSTSPGARCSQPAWSHELMVNYFARGPLIAYGVHGTTAVVLLAAAALLLS